MATTQSKFFAKFTVSPFAAFTLRSIAVLWSGENGLRAIRRRANRLPSAQNDAPPRKYPGRGFDPVRAVFWLFIPLSLLGLGGCQGFRKSAPNRSAKGEPRNRRLARVNDRREAVLRLRDAIERAGGSEVWVKGAPREAFPPRRPDAVVEVLAPPSTFESVLSALKTEAEAQGLAPRAVPARWPDGSGGIEIDIFRGVEPISRWRLHEVRQLLRAAIIIDDLGQSLEAARQLLELPYPVTLSILPHLRHSRETAEDAHRAGREVMLHLPMEPEPGSRVIAGPGEIKVGMPGETVVRTVEADLAAVPYARGVNNHMGSRATADRAVMTAVMSALAEHQVYFVDSRTTADSVAFHVARNMGIPSFYRSVFLDDTETTAYTLGQLRKLGRAARLQGVALAIGHPYPTTLAALRQFLPELEREDVQLVPASRLVRLLEVARLSPPRPTEDSKPAAVPGRQ